MDLKKKRAFLVFIGFSCLMGLPRPAFANPCDSEKSFGREDKTVFGKHCGLCHSMSGRWKRIGPPLNSLFARNRLSTGQPASDQSVREIIMKGGPGLMPGFQHTLTTDQINELLRYLQETRCSETPMAKE